MQTPRSGHVSRVHLYGSGSAHVRQRQRDISSQANDPVAATIHSDPDGGVPLTFSHLWDARLLSAGLVEELRHQDDRREAVGKAWPFKSKNFGLNMGEVARFHAAEDKYGPRYVDERDVPSLDRRGTMQLQDLCGNLVQQDLKRGRFQDGEEVQVQRGPWANLTATGYAQAQRRVGQAGLGEDELRTRVRAILQTSDNRHRITPHVIRRLRAESGSMSGGPAVPRPLVEDEISRFHALVSEKMALAGGGTDMLRPQHELRDIVPWRPADDPAATRLYLSAMKIMDNLHHLNCQRWQLPSSPAVGEGSSKREQMEAMEDSSNPVEDLGPSSAPSRASQMALDVLKKTIHSNMCRDSNWMKFKKLTKTVDLLRGKHQEGKAGGVPGKNSTNNSATGAEVVINPRPCLAQLPASTIVELMHPATAHRLMMLDEADIPSVEKKVIKEGKELGKEVIPGVHWLPVAFDMYAPRYIWKAPGEEYEVGTGPQWNSRTAYKVLVGNKEAVRTARQRYWKVPTLQDSYNLDALMDAWYHCPPFRLECPGVLKRKRACGRYKKRRRVNPPATADDDEEKEAEGNGGGAQGSDGASDQSDWEAEALAEEEGEDCEEEQGHEAGPSRLLRKEKSRPKKRKMMKPNVNDIEGVAAPEASVPGGGSPGSGKEAVTEGDKAMDLGPKDVQAASELPPGSGSRWGGGTLWNKVAPGGYRGDYGSEGSRGPTDGGVLASELWADLPESVQDVLKVAAQVGYSQAVLERTVNRIRGLLSSGQTA